jgi:hypothetical protein
MANHRIIEDLFFRIPLNESGGTGMFGRAKLSAFTKPLPCICSSADCRFSSWMSLNDSAENLRNQKIHYQRISPNIILCMLPLRSFPPRPTNSSKSLARFQVLGGWNKHIILKTDMAPKYMFLRDKCKNQDTAKYLLGNNIQHNNFISYCLHVPNSISIKGMPPENENGSILHYERRKIWLCIIKCDST